MSWQNLYQNFETNRIVGKTNPKHFISVRLLPKVTAMKQVVAACKDVLSSQVTVKGLFQNVEINLSFQQKERDCNNLLKCILYDFKKNNYSILSIEMMYLIQIMLQVTYMKGTSNTACDLQVPAIPNLLSVSYLSCLCLSPSFSSQKPR